MLKLYRYEIDVTEEKSASDTSLVRSTGVTVNVYRQGATAQGADSSTPIVVHDVGSLVQDGLTLKVGSVEGNSETATTNGVPTSTSIAIDNLTAGFSWTDGARIINTSNQPSIYSDDQGAEELAGSTTTTDSNGVAIFYAREAVLDIELDDGTNQQLLTDVPGEAGAVVVRLEDFGGIADGSTDCAQAMTDAIAYLVTHSGGVIELGIGTYVIGSAITSSATSGITIRGQGTGVAGPTQLSYTAGGGTAFAFSGTRSDFKFTNFSIAANAGTVAIVDIGSSITGFVFEDMTFSGTGGTIGVDDSGTDSRYNRVKFEGQFANFIKLDTATRPHINSLVARHTGSITAGIWVTGTTIRARMNLLDIKTKGSSSSVGGTAVLITTGDDIVIANSYLVGGTGTGAAPAVQIDGGTDIQLANNTYSESTIGVDINGGTGITIDGGVVETINADGIDVAVADNVQIRGVLSRVVGASDSHVKIATDKVTVDGLIIGTGNGAYAVEMTSGASEVLISGLAGIAPSTAWILNGSSNTEIFVDHNQDQAVTLSGTETTVAVLGIKTVYLNHSGATDFANMTGGLDGQHVTLVDIVGSTTTVVDTGNLKLLGGGDLVSTQYDSIEFVYVASLALWIEVSRSVNT
jgi:hypothetical protein